MVGWLSLNLYLMNGYADFVSADRQEAQGQLSDLGGGIGDRVQGTVGGIVAGVTGDREAQQKYQAIHDDGKTAQRSAEADIQKQA